MIATSICYKNVPQASPSRLTLSRRVPPFCRTPSVLRCGLAEEPDFVLMLNPLCLGGMVVLPSAAGADFRVLSGYWLSRHLSVGHLATSDPLLAPHPRSDNHRNIKLNFSLWGVNNDSVAFFPLCGCRLIRWCGLTAQR